MGSVIGYQEAHGPVATFETDVAEKIKKLEVDIEPIQEGTGDPSPDNIRPITGWTGAKVTKCGKNLFDMETSVSGYINGNGNVIVKSDAENRTSDFIRVIAGKTYTYSAFPSEKGIGYWTGYSFYREKNLESVSEQRRITEYGLIIPITIPEGINYLRIGSRYLEKGKAQLELGSTATEYEPYHGSTYDLTFPSEAGTVYGGTLDLVKGELVVDMAQIASYNSEALPGKWISDRDVYAAGTSPTTGAHVVYELATPITYQLTPQEISTVIGTNTIYADTGDTSVIYPKTITPIETVSNVNLLELRRSIMMAMQHNYIPEITTYGVEWNYADPSTVLKRTGAAANFANPIPAESLNEVGWSPFDNVYPWSEMKRYNIINGEVAYSQDDAGYSETDYDTVVYIPTFYYKAEKDTVNQKWNWSISGTPLEGYEKHPGSGCYVGRFHTSGSSSGVFSKGGAAPLANVTRANFRTYSKAKGEAWRQMDLKVWSAIQMLYLVEFANWHSQDVLGGGQNSGSVKNTGATTGAAYHTIKRTGNSNAYRWIENPFSNVLTWVDGYVASSKASYITTDPASYGESTTGMENAGITLPSSNYITGLGYSEKCAWAFIPDTASGGSASTYIPDYVYSNSSGTRVLYVGGYWSTHDGYGAFCFSANYSTTSAYAYIGSRLIYIPTT